MAYNAECFQIGNISQLSRTQNTHAAQRSYRSKLYEKPPTGDDFDSVPGGDSNSSEIDWDAEWKKVVEDKKKGTDISRPGQEFYKNDVQRAAAKASRQASEQISKVKIVKPDINMRMLQGDAKVSEFGIVIVIVHVSCTIINRAISSFLKPNLCLFHRSVLDCHFGGHKYWISFGYSTRHGHNPK